ncbi:hypothetical protein ABT097_28170 [Streptomyces sp. NPDC002225]|uniref:hypothetical protein n=1 Tax=Streptomyces sp. NPDC002225 TaxID=3154413 RepID=UPI0033223571
MTSMACPIAETTPPSSTDFTQLLPAAPLRAGWFEDEEQRDTDLGPMPDETEFHQLVQHLVDHGDTRARTAGRRARRTYAEMVPGPYTRQPVLRMTTTSITFTPSPQPAPHGNGRMQCDQCRGWFGFTAWTCDACRAAGR